MVLLTSGANAALAPLAGRAAVAGSHTRDLPAATRGLATLTLTGSLALSLALSLTLALPLPLAFSLALPLPLAFSLAFLFTLTLPWGAAEPATSTFQGALGFGESLLATSAVQTGLLACGGISKRLGSSLQVSGGKGAGRFGELAGQTRIPCGLRLGEVTQSVLESCQLWF